jgi:hypothetical protein
MVTITGNGRLTRPVELRSIQSGMNWGLFRSARETRACVAMPEL